MATASTRATSAIMISSRRRIARRSAIALAPRRAIEDHPGPEVVGELLEPVSRAGRHKEHVPGRETMADRPVHEPATAILDHVDFVLRMRVLRILPARRVQPDPQGSMLERLDVLLGRRLRQRHDRLVHGKTMLHDQPESPAMTSRSER